MEPNHLGQSAQPRPPGARRTDADISRVEKGENHVYYHGFPLLRPQGALVEARTSSGGSPATAEPPLSRSVKRTFISKSTQGYLHHLRNPH